MTLKVLWNWHIWFYDKNIFINYEYLFCPTILKFSELQYNDVTFTDSHLTCKCVPPAADFVQQNQFQGEGEAVHEAKGKESGCEKEKEDEETAYACFLWLL